MTSEDKFEDKITYHNEPLHGKFFSKLSKGSEQKTNLIPLYPQYSRHKSVFLTQGRGVVTENDPYKGIEVFQTIIFLSKKGILEFLCLDLVFSR